MTRQRVPMEESRKAFLEQLASYKARTCHFSGEPVRPPLTSQTLWLPDEPIQHSAFLQAAACVAAAQLKYERTREGGLVVVRGQSGSGKSWFGQWLCSQNPPQVRPDYDLFPVLAVEIPPKPTLRKLAEALLRALRSPATGRGNEDDKTDRVLQLLDRHQVELLVFDELGHFMDHRGASNGEVTDWFKLFVEKSNRATVLMGLPRCRHLIRSNDQLSRRFSSECNLTPFNPDVKQSWLEFRSVLREVHRRTPVPAIEFHDAEVAQRFFFASEGLIGYVYKVVNSAIGLAQITGHDINLEVLGEAFRRDVWAGAPDDLNPFLATELRSLRQKDELFSRWDTTP
jgi:hypothetical protein